MATQAKKVATQEKEVQQKAVVQYKGEVITITFNDVHNLLCPLADRQEVAVFLKTAQSLQLNPFANEIYLIKYSENDKAATVIAIDAYLKAAETNDNYNGHEAGIILKDSAGKLEFRAGSFLLVEEVDKLVGGWAKIYRKDREKPFYMSVNKAECIKYTKEGKVTKFWAKDKQPMMLRKTSLKRALVEAFPSLYSGTISNVDADYEAEVKEVLPEPKGEISEGELLPAYERNGEAYWKLWWARQKEKGLDEEKVHSILGISSLKTDWIGKGQTLEAAEDIINDALAQASVIEEPTEDLYMPEEGIDFTPEPAETRPQPKRDPETIRTINELYKACHEDWDMQPNKVLKESGVSSQSDLSDTPANLYRKIAAARV